jgi:hypothetical protein
LRNCPQSETLYVALRVRLTPTEFAKYSCPLYPHVDEVRFKRAKAQKISAIGAATARMNSDIFRIT